MPARPKDIGTAAETAVVRALHNLGYPHAERRALTGAHDCGDITGTPGITWEIKGGKTAKTASDGQISQWLAETNRERINASADIGILVTARAGIGPERAHLWWAHIEHANVRYPHNAEGSALVQLRLTLEACTRVLRRAGYGTPL